MTQAQGGIPVLPPPLKQQADNNPTLPYGGGRNQIYLHEHTSFAQ